MRKTCCQQLLFLDRDLRPLRTNKTVKRVPCNWPRHSNFPFLLCFDCLSDYFISTQIVNPITKILQLCFTFGFISRSYTEQTKRLEQDDHVNSSNGWMESSVQTADSLYSYLMTTVFKAHRPTDRKLLGLNAFHAKQDVGHAAHLSAGTGVLQQHWQSMNTNTQKLIPTWNDANLTNGQPANVLFTLQKRWLLSRIQKIKLETASIPLARVCKVIIVVYNKWQRLTESLLHRQSEVTPPAPMNDLPLPRPLRPRSPPLSPGVVSNPFSSGRPGVE